MTGSLSSANGTGDGPVRPDIRAFFHPATHSLSYIVSDPQTRRAAIIDPVLDFDPNSGGTTFTSADMPFAAIRQDGLRVERIFVALVAGRIARGAGRGHDPCRDLLHAALVMAAPSSCRRSPVV